jgi:perosamine synthetase
METIPLIEPVVGDAEMSKLRDVIESGHLTQGQYTEQFEEAFADRVGTSNAVCVTSCTVGLELALEACGVGPGDEVLVPGFTYPATATAVVRNGAEPVLVDVDEHTYNLSADELLDHDLEGIDAAIPVSWGGRPLDPEPLRSVARDRGIDLVEDAACSVCAQFDSEPTGSQFDASVFSLHPRKVLATGEGGVVTTDDAELATTLRSIKNFGTDPDDAEISFIRADATNSRFTDLQAAVGLAQLEKLDEIVEHRRELAHRYTDLLGDLEGVVPPAESPEAFHNYQSYCVYIEAGDDSVRDSVIDRLADGGIETQIGTYALHLTDAFADAQRIGTLETSRKLYHNLLTLPVAHSMTDADQHRVVDALETALEAVR